MQKLDSTQEVEIHEIVYDIQIQTDYLIQARMSVQELIINTKSYLREFTVPANQLSNERKLKSRLVLISCPKATKAEKHESDLKTNCS